jgi:Beta-galactosidase trimerisation domain
LSVAALYSEQTRKQFEVDKRPYDFRQSVLGALETLTYAGRPVESLPDFQLNAVGQFEVLVLPEVLVLSTEQAQAIRIWVHNGGTLIASHRCGLLDESRRPRSNFALADVFGVDYVSEETKYAYDASGKQRSGNVVTTYLEATGHPLAATVSQGSVGLPGTFIRMKETTAQAVMRYRLPLLAEDVAHNQWVGWGAPPPGPETAGTAVAFNSFGKGQALYLGVPIFWAMQWRAFWIQTWIPTLIRTLVPKPLAELRTEPFSEFVHGTFFHDEEKQLVLVQVLDAVQLALRGEIRPMPDVEITVDRARLNVTAAQVIWPTVKDLAITQRGMRTRIVIEKPDRYMALYLRCG